MAIGQVCKVPSLEPPGVIEQLQQRGRAKVRKAKDTGRYAVHGFKNLIFREIDQDDVADRMGIILDRLEFDYFPSDRQYHSIRKGNTGQRLQMRGSAGFSCGNLFTKISLCNPFFGFFATDDYRLICKDTCPTTMILVRMRQNNI